MQVATTTDDCLVILQQVTKSGWPADRRRVPEVVRPFWNVRDEVHEAEGLMFLGVKLIFLRRLQKEMLTFLHESHQGIEKIKARAREVMYWPGVARDIEDTVTCCGKCAEWRRNNPKEPVIPHEVPARPWQKLGADLFEFKGTESPMCCGLLLQIS